MAHTDSKPEPGLRFALSYGLSGGPIHTRKLVGLLQAAGHVPTTAEQADIIIAHSAGCWLIPRTAQPRLVIYVGMPLAQAKPLRTWSQAMLSNYRHGSLRGLGLLIGSFYIIRQPRRNAAIVARGKTAQPVIFAKAKAVFIANRDDPWPQADKLQQYLAEQDWSFISLPGPHDDIPQHPERYVAIIDYYARLLAQTGS